MTLNGFQKANSGNLPRLDIMMVASFLATNEKFVSAGLKGVKNARAGRESYGDDAIDYIQLQRTGDNCTVKARVTPEHKVRSKGYNVTVTVNESDEVVLSAQCEDCAASEGGCKHAIALLMWVHRRSEDPAPTSVKCYWKKSKLSGVGTSMKFVKAVDLAPSTNDQPSSKASSSPMGQQGTHTSSSFLKEVLAHGKKFKCESQLLKHFEDIQPHKYLSLNSLAYWFTNNGGGEVKEFLEFCDFHMTASRCKYVEEGTIMQSGMSMWHDLHVGRITASKIHEAARYQTTAGSLAETIMGAKICDNAAMKRGRDLKPLVLQKVQKMVGKEFKKIGLVLNANVPVLVASPDAICDEYVVEVKCSSSEKTVQNYCVNGKLTPKCLGQIQLQMHMSGRMEGLFCVAHPDFEVSQQVDIVTVKYDKAYIEKTINNAMSYWERAIFPRLVGQCAHRQY